MKKDIKQELEAIEARIEEIKATGITIQEHCNNLIKELDALDTFGHCASDDILIPFMEAMDQRMAEADADEKYALRMKYACSVYLKDFSQKLNELEQYYEERL